MNTNPYSPPGEPSQSHRAQDPKSLVHGPATGLIVVSLFCLMAVCVAEMINGILFVSGTVDTLPAPSIGIDKQTQIALRMAWGGLIFLNNVMILVGAVKMQSLRNYRFAMASAILALIPCIGPCYVLAFPLGFGRSSLSKTRVSSLHSSDLQGYNWSQFVVSLNSRP